MTQFIIEIAGQRIAVKAMFESTRAFCTDYLCEGEPHFSVEITGADIDRERDMSAREDRLEGLPVRKYTDAYLETIALQRLAAEWLFSQDILLFHGSAIAVDGQCYLFTAKSGTGKSTHTRLWWELLGEKAVMVNDDKPFLHIAPGGITVFGSPWNGKHHLGSNICVPLKAICVLERGEENIIQPITPKEAVPMIIQQSHCPANPRSVAKYLELLDGLAKGAAFYRLQCTMDPQAATVSYEAMAGDIFPKL